MTRRSFRRCSAPLLVLAASGACAHEIPAPCPPAAVTLRPSATADQVPLTPEFALDRLFRAAAPDPSWLSPTLLEALPVSKLAAVLRQFRLAFGRFQGVRRDGSALVVVLEHGNLGAEFALDEGGRFTQKLYFHALPLATLEPPLSAWRELPGQVSALVTSDGKETASLNPDVELGVGSAFKLSVLATLRAQITQGTRHWQDVIALGAETRSVPSGVLQTWPLGTKITVETLASLMISMSDNTATDTLIDLLGRESIEPFLGPKNHPLLTTRELSQLKNPTNADFLARYRAADESERRALLPELDRRPALPFKAKQPNALDMEWFVSARDLCGLMAKVADLPLMAINPGLARRDDWTHVAYKGGSEPGVLNFTTWVVGGGHTHCVAATWNAPLPLDEGAFALVYETILASLKPRS